jgi:hypothetical protein
MLRYQTTALYDASAISIFSILADFSRMEQWNPNVSSSTIISGEPLQIGTEVRCELRWPFPPGTVLRARLSALEAPHWVTYSERTMLGPFKLGEAEDRLTLEERSDGTLITFETEAELHSVFRVAELLPLSFYERQLDRVAEGLRTLLDSES